MSIIVNGIELTEVIYAGVNLDIVKVKKGTAEAVTVFEKITQLATPQNVTVDGTTVSWDEVENATSYEVLADGTSIGTVEATPTPTLISFTIDGTTYQAEEGMTWAEWCNSSYNTVGYEIRGTDVIKKLTETTRLVVKLNNINVVSSNKIQDNAYTTSRETGGGGGEN